MTTQTTQSERVQTHKTTESEKSRSEENDGHATIAAPEAGVFATATRRVGLKKRALICMYLLITAVFEFFSSQATMLAPGGNRLSAALPARQKGHRNKRKFQPLSDPGKLHQSQIKNPNFDFSKEDNKSSFHKDFRFHQHGGVCEVCTAAATSLASSLMDELDMDGIYPDAYWTDCTETQLEDLALKTLDMMFKTAILKICSYGYDEAVVSKVVLRSGICHGCKDTASNIVDNALVSMEGAKGVDFSKEHMFEDLPQLEKYVLVEMVCVVREVRPFFSKGDAMWCLLICDMNVSHACMTMNDNTSETTSILHSPQSGRVAGIPNLPSLRTSLSINACAMPKLNRNKIHSNSSHCVVEEFSCATVSQSMMNCKKGHASSSRNKSSVHLEKSYRVYKSKGSLRNSKLSNLGSWILDKKCKPSSSLDFTGINLKAASLKRNKSGGSVSATPSLPSTSKKSEISLSIPFKSKSLQDDIKEVRTHSGKRFEKISGQWVPQDKKDEIMFNLVPLVRELQAQMHEWTEWAQSKIMQTARRLSKDKSELQSLRMEKDEMFRHKKEKQSLEESTVKKFKEMKSALLKTCSQVEKDNTVSRSLEAENARLRKEMNAAKLWAAESATSCQEISKREMKTLNNSQSWEREKSVFREELAAEKQNFSEIQKQVEQAKTRLEHLEGNHRREVKMNEEILKHADSERKQREEIEAAAKTKESLIKSEAERNLQTYKSDIQKLEKQLAQMRLTADVSNAAALLLNLTTNNNTCSKDRMLGSKEHSTISTDVAREQECVMCLTEEISVVFVPCGHQVVCYTCNGLHEKQGMKECPSCRTPIVRRISVSYADSKLLL